MCGLPLKVCNAKFYKTSFSLVLFNLMFKIIQGLQQETVVLFAHKASKFRERESMKAETTLGEVDMLTVIHIFQSFGADQKEGERKLSRG